MLFAAGPRVDLMGGYWFVRCCRCWKTISAVESRQVRNDGKLAVDAKRGKKEKRVDGHQDGSFSTALGTTKKIVGYQKREREREREKRRRRRRKKGRRKGGEKREGGWVEQTRMSCKYLL